MEDLVKQLNLPPANFDAYVHLTKVNNNVENYTPEQIMEREKNLLHIIEFRIQRHKRLLRSVENNKWKTESVSKQVLYSLVSWELKSLQDTKRDTERKLPALKLNFKERNLNTSQKP